MRTIAAVVALTLSLVSALYDKSDDVIQLTEAEFNKRVLKDDGIWFVEVYAPWCGHCKNLAPEWKKAAKALKGIVHLAAIDGDAEKGLAGKIGVKGFPTIKVYGANKASPTDYTGGRDAKGIIDAALSEVRSVVQKRSGGKVGGSSSSGGSKGGSTGGGPKASSGGSKGSEKEPGGGKDVVTLTADNFEDVVLGSSEAWMVEIYAPWCGHCKSLAPEWAAAASALSGSGVKLGAIDGTAHESLSQRFGVKGFPTIVSFPPGKKTFASAKPYEGPRSASGIEAAARAIVEAAGGVPSPSIQLSGPGVWTEHCGAETKRICIVAFLPHILDDQSAKRNERLAVLAEAAGSVGRGGTFRFLWAEAGAQAAFESVFNVGMTPSIVAVSENKLLYTPYKGAFNSKAIKGWVEALSARNDGAAPFQEGAIGASKVAVTAPWDGKDAVAPREVDEFSLDDLDL